MKIILTKPDDIVKYNQWYDSLGFYDIWYEKVTRIHDYRNEDIPNEIKELLDKWYIKFNEKSKTFKRKKYIQWAEIEFIYNDTVYGIYPSTLSEVELDITNKLHYNALFDMLIADIIDDLERMKITHFRFLVI